MNELSALRKLAMSSAKACAAIHRRAAGTDTGILAALDDKSSLVAAIAAAHRITARDVDRLADPLVTSNENAAAPDMGMVEHIKFMNQHG